MKLNQYQQEALSTALYSPDVAIQYCTMQLCGESGECSGKIAKVYRDNNGVFTNEKKIEIAKELGDVLWYIANLSNLLGFSLEEIAQMNVNKLKSRQKRSTLRGSGDNR